MIALLLGLLFVGLLVWSVSRVVRNGADHYDTGLLGHDAPHQSATGTPTSEVQVVDDQQPFVDRVCDLIDARKDGGR